jgi:hypothetical protein
MSNPLSTQIDGEPETMSNIDILMNLLPDAGRDLFVQESEINSDILTNLLPDAGRDLFIQESENTQQMPRFDDLPLELRRAVWNEHLPQSRFIILDRLRYSREKPSLLLYANHESRLHMLEKYSIIFLENSGWQGNPPWGNLYNRNHIWVDPIRDRFAISLMQFDNFSIPLLAWSRTFPQFLDTIEVQTPNLLASIEELHFIEIHQHSFISYGMGYITEFSFSEMKKKRTQFESIFKHFKGLKRMVLRFSKKHSIQLQEPYMSNQLRAFYAIIRGFLESNRQNFINEQIPEFSIYGSQGLLPEPPAVNDEQEEDIREFVEGWLQGEYPQST